MKRTYIYPALLLGLSLIGTGCSKNSDDEQNKDPYEEAPFRVLETELKKLEGKTLRLSAVTATPAIDYNNDGTFETEIFPLMSDCLKDNTMLLQSGLKPKWDYGTVRGCSSYTGEEDLSITFGGSLTDPATFRIQGEEGFKPTEYSAYTAVKIDEAAGKVELTRTNRDKSVTFRVVYSL